MTRDGDGGADVVIVGAGVVGTAIARTLARYSVECVLADAACDVGTGTSKANTAILHTGFDAKPGSLESRLLSRGSALLREYAAATGVPVERTGALLVAWTPEQAAALPGIEENARRNGYRAVRQLSPAELYAREPRLGRWRRWRSRMRASSARGRCRWPLRPRQSARVSGWC
jgi:glycerol-3-phosphate dehydrogenase